VLQPLRGTLCSCVCFLASAHSLGAWNKNAQIMMLAEGKTKGQQWSDHNKSDTESCTCYTSPQHHCTNKSNVSSAANNTELRRLMTAVSLAPLRLMLPTPKHDSATAFLPTATVLGGHINHAGNHGLQAARHQLAVPHAAMLTSA